MREGHAVFDQTLELREELTRVFDRTTQVAIDTGLGRQETVRGRRAVRAFLQAMQGSVVQNSVSCSSRKYLIFNLQ